ncbi:MAG: hypothetical protein WBA73_14335 [Devosia sp.]
MTIEELTPEAIALMRSLLNKPQAVPDSPLLRLLQADRLVMGSPTKMHITAQGKRSLVAYELSKE